MYCTITVITNISNQRYFLLFSSIRLLAPLPNNTRARSSFILNISLLRENTKKALLTCTLLPKYLFSKRTAFECAPLTKVGQHLRFGKKINKKTTKIMESQHNYFTLEFSNYNNKQAVFVGRTISSIFKDECKGRETFSCHMNWLPLLRQIMGIRS